MTRKKTKLQILSWIDFILETQPIFNRVIGREFFEKEYVFLKNMKKNINNIEISEKEFEKIEYIAKDLCREINNCMLNLTKLKYLQN
ncbi:hypothetical protein [Desulfothermus sp.]